MSNDLQTRLAAEIHRVDWKPLAPHAERGGLFVVDSCLDLLEVAVAVAADDSDSVKTWIDAGQLARPTDAQVEDWAQQSHECFTVVIVQPYVLAQRDTGPAVT